MSIRALIRPMTHWKEKPVLLTGATGFIGSHLFPRLVAEGLTVHCATRSPERARKRDPDRTWVGLDVESRATLEGALKGCGSAFYLIHQMSNGQDYADREARSAENFRRACEVAGVHRVVYLGGVAPTGKPSRHLASRLATGRILRSGDVSTIELRASMIIGAESASWRIVRDLSARLPVMLLPSWTQSHTEPVAIDDVVHALYGAWALDQTHSDWFDIPGPEVLTIEAILERTAALLGHRSHSIPVPLLTPRLSSYWLRFVTRSDINVARELIEGLKTDLLAQDASFWDLIDHPERIPFDEATSRAIDAAEPPPLPARAVEEIVHSLAGRT
jgi:uncharacterized protein YbjT (DUF2867 family)